MDITVKDIAKLLDGTVIGDDSVRVTGISSITEAGPGDISFLANDRYAPFLAETKASAVLVGQAHDVADLVQIVVTNPDHAFARVVEAYGPQAGRMRPGIDPSAIIGHGCQLGQDIAIGAHCVIGNNVVIGDGAVIHPQSSIGDGAAIGQNNVIYPHVTVREGCQLGERVIVHSGAVIGSDGFGYASVEGVHHKIPQVGIVVVGDDVEIGANSCIDRARFGKTVIGQGTKIDNLVQIAHNVEIGEHCILVAQVGVAGSTRLGKYVTLAGQSGIAGHLQIGDFSVITAQSGVAKNIPAKTTAMGFPATDIKTYRQKEIALRRLPRAVETMRQLEGKIAELEARLTELEGGQA